MRSLPKTEDHGRRCLSPSSASRIVRRDQDRRCQADEDRLADQEMADIEFADMRDGGDGSDIVIGQAMAGMDFQPDDRRRTPRALWMCLSSFSRSSPVALA